VVKFNECSSWASSRKRLSTSLTISTGRLSFLSILLIIRIIFNLLSKKYLEKTNFEEWTNRFTDILDVDVISTEKFENTDDTVFVKFGTTNWVDGEAEYHFYEGTWETVIEEGIYKMNKSKIKEVDDPDYNWFYE